jgi:hypothetical protein
MTIKDVLLDLVRPPPAPAAPPTRLLTPASIQPRTKGDRPPMSRMTKDTLRSIINEVNHDPLAGQGYLTKTDILIDRLLAHWNTVEAPAAERKAPEPILNEAAKPVTAAALGSVAPGSAVKTA